MDIEISKTFGVYQIRNIVNNKLYVGSTTCSFKTRWASWRGDLKNKRTKNKHLLRAWELYGIENFSFEVLEVVSDKEKVLEREQYYINTLKPDYNICPVAGSPMAGRKASEETKIKQSNSLKGRRKNPRPFCKCGELVKEHYTKSGRFHSYYKTCGNIECMKHFIPCSEEKKKKISEAQIRVGNKPSFKGFNHSAETKRRLSEASKIISLGRKHSEETKEKLRQIQKGNTNGTGPRSKEFKEKMSQLMKGNKNGCKK